ncbi:MAG: lytic transglycosylase domain-containing protein, partial [Candidatus Margulisiibacteriota bacterium]
TYERGPFSEEDFSVALDELDEKNPDQLEAIMEIWEQNYAEDLATGESYQTQIHLEKYKALINLGLANYALAEARYLVNLTSDTEKESLQTKLGEILLQCGNYRAPIRFAERKIKKAIYSNTTYSLPKKIWHLAYPKGYWGQVSKQAESFGLDPYLVLAVIREESRFHAQATSRSNAKGLMQIIPKTGKGIAQKLKIKNYRTSKLYDPSLNIKMGSFYLASLLQRFSNNVYLALAGYNGGPSRINSYVNNWYQGKIELIDIDDFIESIPIRETRLYVQKVMGSYFEYQRLYERKRG